MTCSYLWLYPFWLRIIEIIINSVCSTNSITIFAWAFCMMKVEMLGYTIFELAKFSSEFVCLTPMFYIFWIIVHFGFMKINRLFSKKILGHPVKVKYKGKMQTKKYVGSWKYISNAPCIYSGDILLLLNHNSLRGSLTFALRWYANQLDKNWPYPGSIS